MESSASSLALAQRPGGPPPTSSGSSNGVQRPQHQLGAAQQVRNWAGALHKEHLWSASIANSLPTSLLSLAAAAAALALGGPLAAPSMAAVAAQDSAAAEQSFQKSCVGCHAGGGNILQSGANLTLSDLERNGVNSEDSIYSLIYSGRGRMPCTFGPRLSDDEIRALAAFVLQSAAAGWSEAAAP
eukprot:SM000156S02171  [mRNA]  locus=s156:230958:232905:- [translate_table: standard]